MRLYIAEKPSMGREIARSLGKTTNSNGYIKTPKGIVTWLFGHLLKQAEPEDYDPKYKFWNALDLPIVPKQWKMIVEKNAKQQFSIVKKLIASADEIIHAGDPDREGQLLVDELLDFVGNKKPVKRILLNALDEKSILSALSDLRDNKDFFNLKQSALARSHADWLIGMNLSRAYTLAAQRAGHKKLVLPIGRVKTPTLSLVVRREREIQNFKPVDYYLIRADFQHKNAIFTAQWSPKVNKSNKAAFDDNKRLLDKAYAESMLKIFDELPHNAIVSSYNTKLKKESPPLPFSLSALQVSLGRYLGYDPQQVLNAAQNLYEQKLTTYPRSDCSYLPPSQFKNAEEIIKNLKKINNEKFLSYLSKADTTKRSRAWNKSKISAHHAIIPTTKSADLSLLNPIERNTYLFIARQYVAQFMPDFTYDETIVEVSYKDELFNAKGKVVKQIGWREMYTKQQINTNEDELETILPQMQKGDNIEYKKAAILKKTTKPPTQFTSSTLIQGMKNIHEYVKSPESKKQLKDVYGIGTEATRAVIIDDLIKRGFLLTIGKKKTLQPTPKAYLLIDALPDELTYPDETAIWEDKLQSMSQGDGTLEEFLNGQIDFTRKLCQKALECNISSDTIDEVNEKFICPQCKRGILVKRNGRNGTFWGCSNYPGCKMTCNDDKGKPNMQDAQRKLNYKKQDKIYGGAINDF